MARYQLAPVGITDTDTGELIRPNFPGWSEYETWLNVPGNVPDADPTAPQPPSLDERRLRRVRDAEEFMRLAWLARGITVDGVTYRFDRYDYTVLLALDAAGILMLEWRDALGVTHELNPSQRGALARAVVHRLYDLMRKCWEIQDAINAATDPESINPNDYGRI
jgi:hypothetical protein